MAKKYRCLIVDDEQPAHLVITSHLSKFEELCLVDSAFNGKEALQYINQSNYDIIFLDIEMPMINGLDVLQSLSQKPAVIITTAYSNFAFEAYQFDAVDYLLKPVSLPRFVKAVEKAKKYCDSYLPSLQVNELKVKVNGEFITIAFESISHIESYGNYIKIHLSNNKKYVVYDTLKSMEAKLTNTLFIQVHKSYIVNVNYIKKIEKSYLISEYFKLPIGRKYDLLVKKMISSD